jgi:hypothetical protein
VATGEQLASLDALIRRLRELETFPERVAPAVAVKVKEILVQQIAAAQFPSGAAWPDTQDGRKALRNAAKALDVTAVGNVIVARLNGVEARHSVGAVRGHVQRQILPSAKGQLKAISEGVAAVIAEKLKEESNVP